MPNLVSAADVRVLVNTPITDEQLDSIIARVEAEITKKIGAPQNDAGTVEIVKTLQGGEGESLFFPTDLAAIVSVVEDGTTLDPDEYQIWSAGVLERLPSGAHWGRCCVVTYKPADDRLMRIPAIIDVVRIELNRTALKSENFASEYSYSAPENWEKERKKIIKRLTFTAL